MSAILIVIASRVVILGIRVWTPPHHCVGSWGHYLAYHSLLRSITQMRENLTDEVINRLPFVLRKLWLVMRRVFKYLA